MKFVICMIFFYGGGSFAVSRHFWTAWVEVQAGSLSFNTEKRTKSVRKSM